jgi:hypothetical protein
VLQCAFVLSALVSVAGAITGCSGGGVTGSTTTASTPSTTVAGTTGEAGNPLAAVNPCDLLTSDQVNQLDLTTEGPQSNAKSRGCGWRKGATYSMNIDVRDNQGIGPTDSPGVTKVALQSHDAVQDTSSGFGCDIGIAISKSSSADVVVSGAESIQQQCQIATQYATLIEPKLPAQQK